ncbi:23S rRNA (uracil(1939)-C(5))-methyltransferase RlmD [Kordiimonas pumila]|uniref:23S rRNA (Uracil(1939)-C(5))-methyltransferase RlmD n=1 Tax=Kordiimonas pumila TaxID=2161677 RepID=A0ABV7D1Z6_9PROT|nr:23S rRNA (uracil(1939)-C(5))-methyltransferase RlmD [Kordiimonas pumila]
MAEIIELEIISLGAQGDGVGTHGDVPVFVPHTVPGDRVKAVVRETRKNGIYTDLSEVISTGNNRRTPACTHFGTCGGCQLQYVADDYYRSWLVERAQTALAHHGFDSALIQPAHISPPASRRRVALKALKTISGVVLGFNEQKSHQIVDLKECPVSHPDLTKLFAPLRTILGAVLPQRMQAEVHLTLTASGVDMLVEAAINLSLEARESLVGFANDHDLASLHFRDEGFLDPVAIRCEPVMDFAGVKVSLTPASFIQATAEGEATLVAEVLAATEEHKRVADLFAGMGTFTFPLARRHQVLAVEGAKAPLDALKAAADFATGLKQIIPLHRDLFRRPMTAKELTAFDAVVFDPPRAGAKEQVAEIALSDVKTVVGVSCNPNTFGRDARMLADGGYTLTRVVPVDQFLWSPHLELVGVFRKA